MYEECVGIVGWVIGLGKGFGWRGCWEGLVGGNCRLIQ